MQIALVTPELRLVQSPCLADRALCYTDTSFKAEAS
jgi:hypothetical protein